MSSTSKFLAGTALGLGLGVAASLMAVPAVERAPAPPAARPAAAASAAAPAPALSSAPKAFAVTVDPLRPGAEPLAPLPGPREFVEDYLEEDLDEAKVALGRALFHDPRLSSDDTVSCASCHDLRYGGIDRASTATGVRGQVGPINTPTVFNAVLNVAQFWDGRAKDLVAQADGPPNAPGEMASSWPEISEKLLADEAVRALVIDAYDLETIPEPFDEQIWMDAIARFEQTLLTPGAPFDLYLQGDLDAVSDEVKEGYQLFKDVGCIECHKGMAIGGESFQRLGRRNDYFGPHAAGVDLGRFNVTGLEQDRHVFKVPTLRNVALTAPYFHDGSLSSLDEAVRTMARVQLDVELEDAEVERIVRFLESLTGTYEGRTLDPGR